MNIPKKKKKKKKKKKQPTNNKDTIREKNSIIINV